MLTYNAFFQHELKKLIELEIDRLADEMISGYSIDDFPSYRHHIGQIKGLRKALELCDEAERLANGGER